MNAIDRLLNCKANPVEFFELVDLAKAEVEKLIAQTANDAFVIHALRGVESERDALKVALENSDDVIAKISNSIVWANDDDITDLCVKTLKLNSAALAKVKP